MTTTTFLLLLDHPYGCNMYTAAVAINTAAVILCSVIFNCYLVGETAAQDAVSSDNNQLFATSFENLVDKAALLTQDFDIEVQKWKRGEHNNETMASITDSYVPRFQELLTLVKNLQTPEQFENVTKFYLKSLQAELQSNTHYKNSLV